MPNPYFQFKLFTVFHDKCAMKVGADGVTLGAWAEVENAKKILDIGTGSGLIALMLVQRTKADITAIDIDENCVNQALENVKNSPWQSRISVQNVSLQQFSLQTKEQFDKIICNPPYFTDSLKSPSSHRTLARHNDSLPFEELISSVIKLLVDKGKFALILPVKEGYKFVEMAETQGLFCCKKTFLFPNLQKKAKRLLLEFSKENCECATAELIIEQQRGVYTPAYAELVKDFYLKL